MLTYLAICYQSKQFSLVILLSRAWLCALIVFGSCLFVCFLNRLLKSVHFSNKCILKSSILCVGISYLLTDFCIFSFVSMSPFHAIFFRPCCAACSILVPGPGIEPLPWQWKCWVLNAWSLYILKVYLAWAYIFFELIIRLFLIISAKSSNGSKYFLKPALNQTQIFTQQLLR